MGPYRRSRFAVMAVVCIAHTLSACASTPESRLRDDMWGIYRSTAAECQLPNRNFVVQSVEMDGRVHLFGHISSGFDEFRNCYWDGIAAQIERRRAAGLPVPDGLDPHPDIDLDQD
jgi:hypothetical protein